MFSTSVDRHCCGKLWNSYHKRCTSDAVFLFLDQPPSYDSLFGRVQQVKDTSTGNIDFAQKVVGMTFCGLSEYRRYYSFGLTALGVPNAMVTFKGTVSNVIVLSCISETCYLFSVCQIISLIVFATIPIIHLVMGKSLTSRVTGWT